MVFLYSGIVSDYNSCKGDKYNDFLGCNMGLDVKSSNFIAALDIGSSSIITIIAEQGFDDHLALLGWGMAQSRGIKSGVIVNKEEAVGAILESISAAEDMAGERIESVCVSVSGSSIETKHSNAIINLNNSEILEKHIDEVVEMAGSSVCDSEQQILHLLPQYFTVDGQIGITEPLNMVGDELEVCVHAVLTKKAVIQNIVKTVQKAGLIVQDVVFGALAASYSGLSAQVKSMGVCQIDLGEGSTGYCTFTDGMIRDSGVVPVGVSSIISDIAQVLHVNPEEARILYLRYGKAMGSLAKAEDMFEVRSDPDYSSDPIKKVSKATLAAIIEARLEEVFMLIKQQLINKELYPRLGTGIMFTGGGALLPGLSQLAYSIFDFPAKISRGSFVKGLPDNLKSPLYSCALGLLCYHLQSKIDGVSLSYALLSPRKAPVFQRIISSVQKIFI